MIAARHRLALAAAWALVVAVFSYGVLRVLQLRLFPEANPATIVYSAHAGYFWRIWIVLYTSGAAGFVVFWLAKTRSETVAKWLKTAVIISAATITLQSLLFP